MKAEELTWRINPEYINVSWKNTYHVGNEARDTPITYNDIPIGIITDVNETFVNGVLRAKALPAFSCATHLPVSFEIKSNEPVE